MSTGATRFLVTRAVFWADGFTLCPRLVLIHPRAATDHGLRAHELVHVDQMRRDGWTRFVWRYLFRRSWRQAYEVAAFKVSLAHGARLEVIAELLATEYRLRLSVADAVALLVAR